jgi:membrane peptidoglycan carboxypeptidase
VEDRVRLSTLQELVEEVKAVYGARVGEKPYALENLVYHPDFRALMSMRYVIKMARSFGVQSDIPQVLSMPLGAIELSLEEMVALYGGMATGQQPRFPGSRFKPGQVAGLLERSEVVEQKHPTHLIQEIRDRHGNILYRANRTLDEVSDSRFARLTVDVLSNVVLHGTGRRAHRALPNVPMAGKTGTTNAFRNAAFLGIVPSRTGLFTLGAYVGYDDNRSMRRSNTVLHGASGALPAWIKTVEGLSDSGLLSTAKTWDEWDEEEDFERVGVDGSSGLPLQFEEVASPSVLVDSDSFGARRLFSPLGKKAQPLNPRQNWRGP